MEVLWLSLLGGWAFWLSPFLFAHVWKAYQVKVIAKMVLSLSPAERENLKQIQEEALLNRNQSYWSYLNFLQKGKIFQTEFTKNHVICKVLWYNTQFPRLPSYQNFHCATIKPTKEEFHRLKLDENQWTSIVIMTNQRKASVIVAFWDKNRE